ncbi:carboxymuconolactone decarboxylase family protein [Micromonospora thermarum]|uniref:Carboxymuconolactone decarboxylase family protein n=1 Tax=Micromonospora thermarum TaxID=2720024 RepID=A0ABX0Z475_9ACTN|nr:carboxymuconolactone decarboxylase family protein [Micromonospora thermarum]NJP31957.1 carboxymuconolactone decarboxylase family protein [Micromonospora thermarum]
MTSDPVADERRLRGLRNAYELAGKETSDAFIAGLADTCPPLADFITDFVFGDLHGRAELGSRDRELLTLAILAALGGCEREIELHLEIALRIGIEPVTVIETLLHVSAYAGFPRALNAIMVARRVLERRGLLPVGVIEPPEA